MLWSPRQICKMSLYCTKTCLGLTAYMSNGIRIHVLQTKRTSRCMGLTSLSFKSSSPRAIRPFRGHVAWMFCVPIAHTPWVLRQPSRNWLIRLDHPVWLPWLFYASDGDWTGISQQTTWKLRLQYDEPLVLAPNLVGMN